MDSWIGWLQDYDFGEFDKDFCGYVASALVLATFSMKSMWRLRIAAIASNLAFIFYSILAHLHPILVLHCILLPLNVFRLIQLEAAGAARGRTGRVVETPALGASD